MFSKKKKAIGVLDSLFTEIETINDVKQGNNWKSKLKDTLNLYVGENSAISKRVDNLYFTRKETKAYTNAIGFYDIHIYDESLKEDFRDLIRNAKDYIQSNGVYKNPDKRNFLSHFNNAELIGGIVVAVGIIYGIGNYFGKFEKDREILHTETKIQEIEKKNELLILENNNLKQENDSLKKVASTLKNKPVTIVDDTIIKK